MSFLSSIGQYVCDVADSVAGLALSPRRVPVRHRSADETANPRPQSSTAAMRGFPRVVPAESAAAVTPGLHVSLQNRRRTLECLTPPSSLGRRGGSLRFNRQLQAQLPQQPEKPAMAFCRRRLSWPEVDPNVNSGVQETDRSYFESFTALSWRQENRRLAALRLAEARSERAPQYGSELGLPRVPSALSAKEHDNLYTEVLYCISNAVGAPAPGGQFASYKDEVLEYSRRAFKVPPDVHYRALHAAGSERPPVVVLGVHVIEADGLEAKDANGFSDPYCMLGIQPAGLVPASPRDDESRKHSGFRLSFKRRGTTPDGRQHRDSLGRLPARYIRATSVRPHTLSPKWNETFKFDIDDVSSDVLHLDIWDHDDESSVLDAVSRLNEVRGVRGLGRFFKQVCQSARQGSQDDFLGCVNIPLRDIPSTGIEAWYKLEARSQRSTVQGRIRLKMWLSAREAGRHSDDDNWHQLRQHERLFTVLLAHETGSAHEWDGDLCGAAQTLLHQHAVQGDLSQLQAALARWAAAVRLNSDMGLDPKYMHKLLYELEQVWVSPGSEAASRDEERWLADTFAEYIDRSLHQIRLHRDLFPVLHYGCLNKLEFLLRCLALLSQMKAFWKCCPFSKEIRGEVISALRKGTAEWYEALCSQDTDSERGEDLVNLITLVQVDLQQGLTYYHPLFESTNNIPYFTIVYLQIDKMLTEDIKQCVESWIQEGWSGVDEEEVVAHKYNRRMSDNRGTWARTLPFEVLAAIRELVNAATTASVNTGSNSTCEREPPAHIAVAHTWFEPLVDRWLSVTKTMALQRVRAAVDLDRAIEGEQLVKHSTSAVDVAAILYQMRLVWRSVGGSTVSSSGSAKLLDAACATALHYADLIHGDLADQGFYENNGHVKTVEQICTVVNNLEYVRRSLMEYEDELEENSNDGVRQLLSGALTTLEARAQRILAPLAPRALDKIRKAVFHLAWSPDTLPTVQAIQPLLEFLDTHLANLNQWLLSRMFSRVLFSIWTVLLRELACQADAAGPERPHIFHERLREALDLLAEFFHAEGKGLAMCDVKSSEFARVEQRLQYHRAPTEQLIEMWLEFRMAEQAKTPLPSPYGSIFIRPFYHHDSLCVEVMSARDVIPLDPNGFSDPFVIVELLPKRLFPKCNEQITNVQKKTLNPVWDECFEFPINPEHCRRPYAVLCLTVLDKDVLTSDDFAGEAYVSLGKIPGLPAIIDRPPLSPSPFGPHQTPPDPLRPTELPLMQIQDRNHPILQVLEKRTNDKAAIEFVKKQKLRFAEQ